MKNYLAAAAIVSAMLLLAPPVSAQSNTETVDVRLHPVAQLVPPGSVVGQVRVSCPQGSSVLEALVTLSQDNQHLFGQGAIAGITCNGRSEWYQFQVAPQGEPFHRGHAHTSAFVLVLLASGVETLSGGHSRSINVQ